MPEPVTDDIMEVDAAPTKVSEKIYLTSGRPRSRPCEVFVSVLESYLVCEGGNT